MLKKNLLFFIILLIASCLITSYGYSQKKLAQTGFQFLSVGTDARASAMGEAFTTVEGISSTLFYNPAGLSSMTSFIDLSANHTKWIAEIKHYAFSLAINPQQGRYGVFGISVMAVDYGDMQGTMVWGNSQGYVDTEVFSPSALAVGIGYGMALTDRFSVGGQIKYVTQSLGKSVIPEEGVSKNVSGAMAFDFGTIYKTGFRSLNFGMSIRNFSEELTYEKEGFQLPLTFTIGLSVDPLDFLYEDHQNHTLLVVVDAVHPRSFPEYFNLGTEYVFMKMFALRMGYISGHEEYGMTMGFGLKSFGLAANYSYTPFGVFDGVHRYTVSFSM